MAGLKGKNSIMISLSKKQDGPMSSPGFLVGKFDDGTILKNREKFFKKIEIDPNLVVTVGSLHKSNLKVVGKNDAGKIFKNKDGLLSNEKNLFLSLSVSDCLPVYLYDSKKHAVGLLHCGWRGIIVNIIEKGIKKMEAKFGSLPKNITATIGPGISKCHFEVGPEVAQKFNSSDKFIDLKSIARERLLKVGLLKKNITTSPDCTFCMDKEYFSFRRDKPKFPQNMVAVIGIKEKQK